MDIPAKTDNHLKAAFGLRGPLCVRAIMISLIFALTAVFHARGFNDVTEARLLRFSADSLMVRGDRYMERNDIDSAFIYYSLIINRLKSSDDSGDMIKCATAYDKLWRIYFIHYFNYSKALECLSKAKKINDKYNIVNPAVNMHFGGIYQNIYKFTHDRRTGEQAFDCFRQAFGEALKTNDGRTANSSFSNLINAARGLDRLSSISKEWDQYRALNLDSLKEFAIYTKLLYEAYELMEKGDNKGAAAKFRSQLEIMPDDARHFRYRANSLRELSFLASADSDWKTALGYANEIGEIARRHGSLDLLTDNYDRISTIYEASGNKNEWMKFRSLYLEKKDSLLHYRQIQDIENIHHLTAMEEANERLADLARDNEQQKRAILIVGLFTLTICLFSFFLYRKNKRLVDANSALYQKNLSLIYLADNNALGEKKPEKPKSQGISIDPALKKTLVDGINRLISDTARVCDPNFTQHYMAQELHTNVRYLSQVINEEFGCNFNTLINNARIKEACRTIYEDKGIALLTIEAVAMKFGFNSRNTFTQAFKKATGLSPSEFIKKRREEEKIG